MKRTAIYMLLTSLIINISCSREITSRLKKYDERVRLSQPAIKDTEKESISTEAPKHITYVDKEGLEHTVTKSEVDKDGENISVIDLQGVMVTAKSKNVSERRGKVNLDFIVTVPGTLLSSKWQLQLTPVLYKKSEQIELDKIFLSGADFLKTQQKGYAMYQSFINSIIPDEEYLQHLFDEKGYKRAMQDLENEFYQSWRRDLLWEKEYIDWTDKINKRYLIFNNKVERNKRRLTGTRPIVGILPEYWLIRDIEKGTAPDKYKMFLDDYRIVKKEITPADSARIEERFFDYKKMMENERKKGMVEDKYKEYVRFPYEQARLDSIVQSGDNFQYYYVQEVDATDDVKKIDLTLNGLVVAKDESTYRLPDSDTITFYISSMLQFLDETERYKLKIVERQAEVNLTSFIAFEQGKSAIKEELAENEKELSQIFETIEKLTFSGELIMDSISMTATASPEGSAALNKSLSMQRSESLKNYLIKKTDDKESIDTLISAKAIGEDWDRLTAKIVNAAYEDLPHKKEILSIIESESNPDERESQIKKKYAEDYAYISQHIYPDLRAVHFKFNLHRRDMIKDTIHTTVIDDYYHRGVDYLQQRKYKDALVILSDYNDFNTGVCLMSLGYDGRAYEILSGTDDNANRNYLLSILATRLRREEDAVRYFLKACEEDESKIWRGKLDPEINRIMTAYNLFPNEQL
ncbi:OmpA family protein [Massilibacteroides vaginae]|uniref:OmpA family protein n=1 Tax=Massilibacteroides vaginae TaxID=1673718 RepID=UPI000A1CC88D|nr:OmpA family protein [Massilibacteroides vaginae]